jgi:predicted Zn-dependent protease
MAKLLDITSVRNALAAFGVALFASACATVDSTPDAPAVNAGERARAGQQHPQIVAQFGGAVDGPLGTYVGGVGERLATIAGVPGQCTFTVINTDVVNAFAVPGCYIYMTRGLLAIMNSEDELASVLGHEVGHVVADHSAQRQNTAALSGLGAIAVGILTGSGDLARLAGQAGQLYALDYSREQEFESDDLGVRYLAGAGYNLYAASDMLNALGVNDALTARTSNRQAASAIPAWARTHPLSADRVNRSVAHANAQAAATGGSRDVPPERVGPYMAAINGMIWGDDPEQGFVNGRTFAHPVMRIAFDAPEGFTLTNTAAAVIVSGQNARAQFSGGGALQGTLDAYATEVLRRTLGQAPAQVGQAQRTTTNGLATVYIPARAQNQSGQVLDVAVAAYQVGDRAYHFVTLAPSGGGGALTPLLRSMRALSAQEAGALRARRIEVVQVGARDTVASLSRRMAFDTYQEDRFRAINGLGASDTVRAGQQMKLITYVR